MSSLLLVCSLRGLRPLFRSHRVTVTVNMTSSAAFAPIPRSSPALCSSSSSFSFCSSSTSSSVFVSCSPSSIAASFTASPSSIIALTGSRTFRSQPLNPGPPRIVFLGAPGVGKGTFARLIAPLFDWRVVSTGNLIREQIRAGTELGKQIQAMAESGTLIPDEVVTNMAKERLDALSSTGIILDGFPRTLQQAHALDAMCGVDMAINLSIHTDVLVEKTTSRRMCEKCGEGYNVAKIKQGGVDMEPLLPKIDGVCDKCGGRLVQRADDTAEVVKRRLLVYENETFPLIEYYARREVLQTFAIQRGVADMPRLIELFTRFGAVQSKRHHNHAAKR